VKITIEMSPKNYDGLLSKVAVGSLAYSLLKNAIVNYHAERGTEHRVIDILCEPVEAKALLRVAKEVWPEAAFEINDSIARGNVLR
jgi:hypothetical protein